jgi:hypothetical protein
LVDSSRLENISAALTSLPKDDREVSYTALVEKSENEDKIHGEKVGKHSRRQRIVSQGRKAIKEYNLYFQGAVSGSSKTD